MSLGQFQHQSGGANGKGMAPLADINVTPMVDVMLVLLAIFIIAAPLMAPTIKLDLPKTEASPAAAPPQTVGVSLDGGGRIYWHKEELSFDQLRARLQQAAKLQPQPALQLLADKDVRYEQIAQVMAAAQAQGLAKLGFITGRAGAAAPLSQPSPLPAGAPSTSRQ
jgi:biopolymer transport protein ExbD